ncbi:MAG: nonstructural protein [Arizlama microvirus]|nr:MAG: nonstructural protein [Arizlama microvirus]
MSILKLFSVRDNKVSSYLRPFVEQSEIQAIRGLTSVVNSGEKSQINDYPEDFDLYLLAEMDDITGKIIPQEPPKFIIAAINTKRKDSING